MTLNYPSEVDFSSVDIQIESITTEEDIDTLLTQLEPIAESESTTPTDLMLYKMGLYTNDEETVLWGDLAVTIFKDIRGVLMIRDHTQPVEGKYEHREIEDLKQFILSWFTGELVPAAQPSGWIPRHEHEQKTYALAGENTQDPQTEYRTIGNPVTVNTKDMEDTDIFDLVYDTVEDQPNITTLPEKENPDLFLIEIEEFDAIRR